MPNAKPRPSSRAYRDLPVPAAQARPFDHLIQPRVDTPEQAAQRRIQEIGHEAYQLATSQKRVTAILEELKRETENPNEAIATVARDVLQRSTSLIAYMAKFPPPAEPQAEVYVIQDRHPDPLQAIRDDQAAKQQRQL